MNSLTTIYLIRHGDTEYPVDDLGRKRIYGPEAKLTELGVNQMQVLARKLREDGIRFYKIYTSPYVRARQSAEIIAAELGVPTIIEKEDLADIRVPHHIGLLWEDIFSGNLPHFDDHEAHEQVADRMVRIFREIHDEGKGHSIGIVSHGDSIRVLMYCLQEGEGFLPPITELSKYDYLNKGEAWKLSLDQEVDLVSLDFITTRKGRSPRRERSD